jgi:hypothetical protein
MQNITLEQSSLPEGSTLETQDQSNEPGFDQDSLDIFNFNEPIAEQPVAEEATAPVIDSPEVVTPPQPVEDNWEIRAKYYQSEFDKTKQFLPLVQYIQENPQVLDVIEKHLTETAKPTPVAPSITVPVKPVRPADFNAGDAYNDISSASAKYLDELTTYQEKMAEYIDTKEQARLTAIQEAEAQSAAQQEHAQQIAGIKSQVKQKFTASDTEVDEFVSEMSDPKSISLDNLWALYQYRKGKLQPSVQPTAPKFKQPYAFATPAGTQASGTNAPTPEDANSLFNKMLR